MGAIISTLVTVSLTLLSTDAVFLGKWITSYVYIKLFRRRTIRRFDPYDMGAKKDPYKVGFIPTPQEVALESPVPEHQLLDTADELFCYGVNSKSECLIIRVARGTNHEADAWIYMKLSDGRVYQLKETSSFQRSCCDKRAFTCGDLQMHYLSPMRRWRIFFNGMLRELNNDDSSPEKMVHVKFALLWIASSDTFDFLSDLNTGALAAGLAKAKWEQFLPPLEKLYAALNFYSQAGAIMGSVSIEGDEDEHDLYLFGEKIRILGETSVGKPGEFVHVLGWTSKNGRFVHVAEVSIENIVENLTFGFVVQPIGDISIITDTSIELENLFDEEENDVEAKFYADEQLYELQGALVGGQAHFQSGKGWDGRLTVGCLNFQMNSFKGSGIVIKGKLMESSKRIAPKALVLQTSSVVPLVLHFSDQICQHPEITGGKGSSLGKLTELSKEFQNFVVPNGIVVTTAAYENFLTDDVLREIKSLENVLYNQKGGDVKAACEKVIDEVVQSTIPDKIVQEVVTNIKKFFSDRKDTHKFAVRSSATGEDTEQMSAAGQMETYLGIAGIEEILLAVKKCWASQFSYIAVQYKRQNGQIINSPMAVVIQQMISCDVAGVLFTCDPLTGSPNAMSITANYGLGESVVSGSEEPDTIEIGRYEDDELVIKNKIIGSKNRRIVLRDDEGTNIEDVPEHERAECCLTDEMALRLGCLAAKIEKSYRSHRDIEWGFWNNNLYIFQSRPVTSGTGETDFEIDHEMDSPLRVENEYFTVCNVGEVMPGAMSPLGLDIMLKLFHIIFQKPSMGGWAQVTRSKYFSSGMCSMYNRVMFYCVEFFKTISDDKPAMESASIGLFGRLLEDGDIFEWAREKYANVQRPSIFKEHINRIRLLLYFSSRQLKKEQNAYSGYRIPVEKYKTAQELCDALLFSCSDMIQGMSTHMMCSETSSILNIIILTILRTTRGELDADVYGDFAQLVKTFSDVESADVPAAIEKLAANISKDIKPEDFKRMDINEAVRWLETSTTVSGIKYREFLLKHGHRCLKEFDIRSTTWAKNPNSLIQLLLNLVGSVKKERIEEASGSFKELISELKIPLDFITRLVMRILLPLSRRAVRNRESSKSLVIRVFDVWRNAYSRLAKLMVSEGRIPDEDLLYFMTLEDIKELLSSRSPKIIAKANHRRRRHPTLNGYMFPEIMKGFPKPINMDTDPIVTNDDNFSMKGIPVSQGITKGFVRVALTLEEASFLQPGEILVTYSTDIGWSPYFPILGGVVTEIGGLISHGAVVSREYGLPCIAGLHGATRQFQTGDYVLLDGYKGILQKLSKPENQ